MVWALAAHTNGLPFVAADRAVVPLMEPMAPRDLPGGLEDELLELWPRGHLDVSYSTLRSARSPTVRPRREADGK
jgi:hypothetical protein